MTRMAQGRRREAVDEYRGAARILKKLTGEPTDPFHRLEWWRVGLARTLNNLGQVYQTEGQYDKAIECFENAVRVWDQTYIKWPGNLASAYAGLGGAYFKKLDLPKAKEQVLKAHDLTDLLVIEHRDADDVSGRHLGNAVGHRRAGFGQGGHRLGPHVENGQPSRPVDQPSGHRRAHVAQADVAELDVTVRHVVTPHERMICPPSTLKICPVIHDA